MSVSIVKAIERAYLIAKTRNWDRVYWCLDLHGTVLESNYSSDSYNFLNQEVISALQQLTSYPETRIILWSSIHDNDSREVIRLFNQHQIRVDWVNENPEVANTTTGCFTEKFYFSILVDDKAGFDPSEWPEVAASVAIARKQITGE